MKELDHLSIRAIVNDQLDNIAPSRHHEVQAAGRFSHVPLRELEPKERTERGGAKHELHLPNSCCGAHGLSLMITASRGTTKHTMLFDAGPEGMIWETNVKRLGLETAVRDVELIHLSHWHRDHSGGFESAIAMISKDRTTAPVTVDLHPNRPQYRGIMLPHGPVTLEADPTFDELTAAGAKVEHHAETHNILEDHFLISGEIPRHTSYESGFPNGIRLDSETTGWVADPFITDERFVMCHLKGKGLVVFTGCSHAGVVNVVNHAAEIGNGIPIFAVVGGFHLSDAPEDKLKSTVKDLALHKPRVLMPGHCTGWQFSVEAERSMPGSVVPLYCGQKYEMKGGA